MAGSLSHDREGKPGEAKNYRPRSPLKTLSIAVTSFTSSNGLLT
jgi:hypothetical protein